MLRSAALFASSLAVCLSLAGAADELPGDVSRAQWAAPYVARVVKSGVLVVRNGKFNGEGLVTHADAAIALSHLGEALLTGKWHVDASKPVPISAVHTLANAGWKQRPVTRYTLAYDMAHVADYVANGVPAPPSGAKDLSKSELFEPVTVKATKQSSAYSALTYLAAHRLVQPTSPLLAGDTRPLRGEELSLALTQFVAGVNDALTPLDRNPDGSTPDSTFHKKHSSTQ